MQKVLTAIIALLLRLPMGTSPADRQQPPFDEESGIRQTRSLAGPAFRMTALHLFALNALAVAQPLLDRLQHNSAYLTQEQIGPTALIVVVVVLLTALPLALLLPLAISQRIGRKTYGGVRFGTVFLMVGLIALSVLGWLSRKFDLLTLGVPGLLLLLIASAIAAFVAFHYPRRQIVSGGMTFLSIGIIAIPAAFFAAAPVKAILFPSPPEIADDRPQIDNPVPVILVVFDGLSGMALLDETHQIDAVRYPSFARLAGQSTWYRNASSVHCRTDNAVPAILSGNYPSGQKLPTEAEYSQNLLSLIHQSGQYELSVFEPYTRLCPEELQPRPPQGSVTQQTQNLIQTLCRVYLVTTLPQDVPIWRSGIPRSWFGLRDTFRIDRSGRVGLFRYSWDVDRSIQVDHFRDCLLPTDTPAFRFLHLVAPHYPWKYLPSGRSYAREVDALNFPVGAYGVHGEEWTTDSLAVHHAWQRYLLQLQAVDRWLGEIIDDLESRNLFDECLLIVTSDHGVAFQPGISRRDPLPQNLPDILPVPLLIKFPGVSSGRISDRNVESIDILPTIADVLRLDLKEPTDGWSVLEETGADKPRKTLAGGETPLVVPGAFPEKYRYTDRMLAIFGSGRDDRLFSLNVIPELIGRPKSELQFGDKSPLRIELEWATESLSESLPSFVPCLFSGTAEGHVRGTPPTHLAVLINGVVAATTRTYDDPRIHTRFAAMIPESVFEGGLSEVSVCEVREAGERYTLHDCTCNFAKPPAEPHISGREEIEQ